MKRNELMYYEQKLIVQSQPYQNEKTEIEPLRWILVMSMIIFMRNICIFGMLDI